MEPASDAMRQALEDAMNKFGYEYQSDFARKYVAQGEAQEACRLVLRQLARRFGLLGQPLQASITTSGHGTTRVA